VPDYRDLVIEILADSEAMLLSWIEDLISDRDAYRLLAQHAIHHCHAQYAQLTRLRTGHERLIAEYRVLREQTITCDLEAM
jgi:hypothetical protein